MKSKKFVLAGLAMLATIITGLTLISCETEVEPVDPPAKYTVTFNTDGGSEVASQTVESGKTATKPEAPTKTSYDFAGWYSDKEGTTPYSFDTPVTKKITLHAKWTSKESGGDSTGNDNTGGKNTGSSDKTNTSGGGDTDNGEEKPGSGENNTVSKPCSHQPEADDGDCTTEVKCRVCGEITTPAKKNHTGGIATCTEKAKCTACGTAYGTVDANNHIDENTDHICDRECGMTNLGTHADSEEDNDHLCDYGCGATLEEHTGGVATCVKGKLCEVCGVEYDTTLNSENHTSTEFTYTENNDGTHNKLYACCGAVHTKNEACSGGTATCVSGKICDFCETAYGDVDPENHTSEGYTYVYTWAETTPTSIKNYTCLHCEKAIAEPISPSVWQVGDKVTYIAKDDNPYVSTVGEITDGKAVLVSDTDYSATGKYGESALLALLEPVGARFPTTSEIAYTMIIKPWLLEVIKSIDGEISPVYHADSWYYAYKSSSGFIKAVDAWSRGNYSKTWRYKYMWDVEFSTAE